MVVSRSTEIDTYLAFVPVTQLVVEPLIVACLEHLAKAVPTSANCLADISHTAFLGKLV